MTFRLTPGRFITETHEAGFTLANVQAICSTAGSSKAKTLDTTGEQGLGFKPVFGISNRVNVQSGLWSFRFEHEDDDVDDDVDGAGMVIPIWTKAGVVDSANIGTRLQLQYSISDDDFLARVVTEFEAIPSTTVFAFRTLRKVIARLEDVLDRNDEIIFQKEVGSSLREMTMDTVVNRTFGQHATGQLRLLGFR